MRFYSYINELFQRKLDWEIIDKNKKLFNAAFKVKDTRFIVTCYEFDGKDNGWEFSFEDADRREVNITNMQKENAMMVYSYVISIIKYFIEKYRPNLINLLPTTPKQGKIYSVLIKRLKKFIDKQEYEITKNTLEVKTIEKKE